MLHVGIWPISLLNQIQAAITIDAIDISTAMFPKTYPTSLSFHERKITSLPPEWTSRFKFVHQRFLVAGIPATEWPLIVSEHFRVLQPGGYIQMTEFKFMDWNKTPAERKHLGFYKEILESKGLMLDCGMKLPQMLQTAGFADIHMEIRPIPLGKQAGEDSAIYAEHLLDVLYKVAVKAGISHAFGLSVNEYKDVLAQIKAEWDSEIDGRKIDIIVAHARKP